MLNLPIDILRNQISRHEGVKIITAAFGAGKTLRVPKWLSDKRNEQYLVIPPKRRLAQVGANNMSAVYADPGHPLRYGYCVHGEQQQKRTYDKNTQVLFTTPGVALHRGLVHKHHNIILDEVQERSMMHSCISAILKRRMDSGDQIDLTLMSATLDPSVELEYWKDYNPMVFTCDNNGAVPIKNVGESDPIGSVSWLVEEGHKGIIVFVDGERTIREMRQRLLQVSSVMKIPFHISVAHSNMAMSDLAEADAPTAPGAVRILLSTNVSESGVRYRWKPTAVVSTGQGKCFVEKNGVSTLYSTDLTQDRILQQSGRVSDTTPHSVMLLHGTQFENRPAIWPSENSRMPIEYLVKTAISVNEDPRTLDFGSDVKSEDIQDAIHRLRALGILTNTDKITSAGAFVMSIPDSYRVGLMMHHATLVGNLPDVILPAIAVTAGKFYRRSNYGDTSAFGDRSVMTVQSIVCDIANTFGRPRSEIVEYASKYNISLRSLLDAHNRVLAVIDAVNNVVPTLVRYKQLPAQHHSFDANVEECILAGHLDVVYGVAQDDKGKFKCIDMDGTPMPYTLHHSPTGDPRASFLATAQLKTNGQTATRADSVCMIRSSAVRSYINRTAMPFQHDNPVHQRLVTIASTCMSISGKMEFLGMLPEWIELNKGNAEHIGKLSNAFMVYQDERVENVDDQLMDMPKIKPRRKVVRNFPTNNSKRSSQILKDALLMASLTNPR